MAFRLLIFFLLFSFLANSQPTLTWAKSFDGTSPPGSATTRMTTTDKTGNVYIIGTYYATVDFDPGPGTYTLTMNWGSGGMQIFIVKLDPAGNFLWAKAFNDLYHSMPYMSVNSIGVDDSCNVYTTGTFYHTVDFDPGNGVHPLTSTQNAAVFISKLDKNGNFVWARSISNNDNPEAYTIHVIPKGDIYITGTFRGAMDLDPGPATFILSGNSNNYNSFFLKLNPAGQFIWAKAFSGQGASTITTAVLDTSENIYAAGNYGGSVDFDPGPSSCIYTTGGYYRAFICKLDSAGNFINTFTIGGTGNTDIWSLGLDRSNNIYSTGSFQGTVDFDPGPATYTILAPGNTKRTFVSKLSNAGLFIFTKELYSSYAQYGTALAIDTESNVYVTGYFYDTLFVDPGVSNTYLNCYKWYSDIFLCQYDSPGAFTCGTRLGGAQTDYAQSMNIDKHGDLFLTGAFGDSTDFDPGPATYYCPNNQGAFVCKFTGCTNKGTSQIYSAKSTSLQIFPNPSKGEFRIKCSEKINRSDVRIFNTLGEQQSFDITDNVIYLNNISRGLILVELHQGHSSRSIKIFIDPDQ